MQGRSGLDRDLWDAGEVTGHLVRPGSVFAFLAAHRGELFPDSFTADLFPSATGRPSLPGDLVGVISTVDRDARHTRKSKSKRRDGFRGHVAAEPDTGLITDCEMTMAAGDGSSDADNGVKMAARDRFHGACEDEAAGDDAASARDDAKAGPSGASPGAAAAPQPEPRTDVPADKVDQAREDDLGREDGLEVYGDSAYGSGEARAAYRDAGTTRSSSRSRCSPPCPAGSPSMISLSMRTAARSPARPGRSGR